MAGFSTIKQRGGGQMTKLEYTFKNDILFKIIFTKYQHLLKNLVADFLAIEHGDIEEFLVINPELYPDEVGKKFCRLDINIKVNGQLIDIEIQVENEGNYPTRALYYWAKEFSNSLNEGEDYSELPKTIIISILGFRQFQNPNKFHHEFWPLEITTYEPLTDKCQLHFYELPKLPPLDEKDEGKNLWLQLFNAKTEEDLEKISKMEVDVMSQAIEAYRQAVVAPEFKELHRIRQKRHHDEVNAISYAKKQAAEEERQKWQDIVADRDAENAKLREELERLRSTQNDQQ